MIFSVTATIAAVCAFEGQEAAALAVGEQVAQLDLLPTRHGAGCSAADELQGMPPSWS